MGRRLRMLLVAGGFTAVRVEVEVVAHPSRDEPADIISLERAAEHAWRAAPLTRPRMQALLAEQRELSATGAFHATLNRSTPAWARRPVS